MNAKRSPLPAPVARLARAMARGLRGRVALACSGGVDSTAMLLLASAARDRNWAPPFVAVHVDHRTRAETADDAEFVAGLCRRLEVPLVRTRVRAVPQGERSPEAHLRELRYEALGDVLDVLGLDGVVTAHTLDDQVETILMRLLTGSGAAGAAGMRRESSLSTRTGQVTVLRPLLDTRRRELIEVLDVCGVRPRIDPSNLDRRYLRNTIRQDIIPLLARCVVGYEGALSRSVELAARDADFADACAESAFVDAVSLAEGVVHVDRTWLRSAHPALASRVLRLALARLGGTDLRETGFERIEALRLAAFRRSGAIIELPGGIHAKVTARHIDLWREDQRNGTGR